MYYSQHGEDKYIEQFFDKEYKGVCVEVGAYDGIGLSNTYYFEKNGWRALCIEPISSAYEKCKEVRTESIKCCAGSNESTMCDFTVYHLNDNLCAISSLIPDERLVDSHKHLITNVSKETVETYKLTTILDKFNYPIDIDFISIDTENTELDVLQSLDFNKYNVKYFIIENNYDEPMCENFLKEKGYKKIHRIAVNDFFVKI